MQQKKLSINGIGLLMVFAVLLLPLIGSHSANIVNVVALLTCTTCFYVIGAALLVPVRLACSMLMVSHAALSVFVGALLCSLTLFVTLSPLFIIAALLVISAAVLFYYRAYTSVSIVTTLPNIMAYGIVLVFIALISGSEGNKMFSATQEANLCNSTDSYFFTAVVTSLRQGTIFSASYETGSPVNYQILGFFIPAFLANILNISSHLALWGLTSLFYKMVALLLCYELSYSFFKDKILRTNYLFMILGTGLPILLAPLHPLYIAKGDVKNFIFNGIGYLVPSGTFTYPIAIILFFLSLYLFFQADWKDRKLSAEKVFFGIALALTIIGKVPFYIAYIMMIAAIVLKRVLLNKEKITTYLWYGGGSLALSYIVLKICMGLSAGGKTYFKYGYLTETVASWYHRNTDGAVNQLLLLALLLATFLVWLGIKLAGLTALARAGNAKFTDLAIGSIVSLAGTTLLACFMRMEILDHNGAVIADNTFNVEQFLRSSFYILSVAGSVGLLHLLFTTDIKLPYRRIATMVTVMWCGLTLTAMLAPHKTSKTNCGPLTWYYDNYSELKTGKYNDGLIVVNPSLQYYGLMLAASDLGKYWTAMDRSTGNYNSTIINEYRWELFKNLLATPDEQYLRQMNAEGVRYIIATPIDQPKLDSISTIYPQALHKIAGTKWIFELGK